MTEHLECIVELKDGETEWFDPVDGDSVYVDRGYLIVRTYTNGEYHYDIGEVLGYDVRPYCPHKTYYSIEKYHKVMEDEEN